MSIDLLSMLSSYTPFDDRENNVAWFRTRVPRVAPEAYFNIIFKPADSALLYEVSERWDFPEDLVDFLLHQNGARLFAGALSFYGVVNPGQLLNRRDPYSLPPFNIDQENKYWSLDKDRLVVAGGYRSDGSRLCIDRSNSRIHVFRRGGKIALASWQNLEHCIISEVARFKAMYDSGGNKIGDIDNGPPTHFTN